MQRKVAGAASDVKARPTPAGPPRPAHADPDQVEAQRLRKAQRPEISPASRARGSVALLSDALSRWSAAR
jgi:hypothetical protein